MGRLVKGDGEGQQAQDGKSLRRVQPPLKSAVGRHQASAVLEGP